MLRIITFLLLLISTDIYGQDTLIKKYCVAYNTMFSKKKVDNNLYLYGNFYNSKRDYFLYLNYFDRQQNTSTLKSLSWGVFFDQTLSKRTFFWSFHQGEKTINSNFTSNQFAAGLGVYVINKNNIYITINNGPHLRLETTSQFRHNFRIKSRITFRRMYFETYNYIQPKYEFLQDISFITFNTFTYRIHGKVNAKIYQWYSGNNISGDRFGYFIVGLSLENW